MLLLTLRGTPFLYYGDEIGHEDVEVPEALARPGRLRDGDPSATATAAGRPCRGAASPGAGFTRAGRRAVAADRRRGRPQRRRPARGPGLGAAPRPRPDRAAAQRPDLRAGAYESLPAPDGAWVYRRGDDRAVALNLSGAPAAVEGVEGTVAISTSRARDGAPVGPDLVLEPWEGVVVAGS